MCVSMLAFVGMHARLCEDVCVSLADRPSVCPHACSCVQMFDRTCVRSSMHSFVCLHTRVHEDICLSPSGLPSVCLSVCLSVRVHVRASKDLFAMRAFISMRDISYS